MKALRRLCGCVALALCLCFLLSACARSASPQRPSPTPAAPESAPPEEPVAVPSVPEAAEEPPYPDVGVYFDGLLTDKGYMVGDTLYLSPEAICGFFGMELRTEGRQGDLTLSGPGLTLTASPGQEYMVANGRYLYTPYGFFLSGGRVFLPADAIERMFGLRVLLEEDGSRAEIAGGSLQLLKGGENYYESRYNSEDLFWLSRIIYSEAHGEPFAGMIGVGQVVLNRVESPDFPNTVYTVVFDNEYAVQFDPTATGGVYEQPDELALIAACLALEGYDTVGESLYFVNPERGASGWFEKDLTPVVVIGHHHFYC